MIRFILGLILVFGGVGAIEMNESVGTSLSLVTVGMALMLWSVSYFKKGAGL